LYLPFSPIPKAKCLTRFGVAAKLFSPSFPVREGGPIFYMLPRIVDPTAAFQVAANAPGETLAPEILKIPIYELSTTVLTLFLLLGEACFKSVMRGECASAGERAGVEVKS
jgi:hypothetical protein